MSKSKKHSDTNAFGGKNPHGLYVPMSEDEQEVVHRLVETQDLEVVARWSIPGKKTLLLTDNTPEEEGWARFPNPPVIIGDHRIAIDLRLCFSKPEVPVPIYFIDLELRTQSGRTIFRKKEPTLIEGHPFEISEGVELCMRWDIAIDHMDPRMVKHVKPGALGLTSRRLDRDTGQRTLTGNMKVDSQKKRLLGLMHTSEQKVKEREEKRMQKMVQLNKEKGQ